MLNVVLVAPEIPQNTGNIGRLCVNTGSRLHLIRPLGFSLDGARVRRAGLDYWPNLDVCVHDDWAVFLRSVVPQRLVFASTKSDRSIYSVRFREADCVVFGNESSGLPPGFYETYRDALYRIPLCGAHARSLNLANAVAVVLYEALRQLSDW